MARFFSVFVIALAAFGTATPGDAQGPPPTGGNMLVYVGTYTGGKSNVFFKYTVTTEN